MSDLVTMTETNETREFWAQQGLGANHLSAIASADALIVPEKDFREGIPFVFHQDTTHLYDFLREHLDGKLQLELCADDAEYIEISLHSASFRISKIVVSYAAVPLIIGLLTNYIYDQLKAKPTDNVEASIVVEDHECRAFKFSFKGEAKDFHVLADQVGEMARNCEATKAGKKKAKP